jgi:hypothetical protein
VVITPQILHFLMMAKDLSQTAQGGMVYNTTPSTPLPALSAGASGSCGVFNYAPPYPASYTDRRASRPARAHPKTGAVHISVEIVENRFTHKRLQQVAQGSLTVGYRVRID